MKILILAACLINLGDDAGGTHHDEGQIADVPKEPATSLVRAGRALYVNPNDDPDKGRRNTANKDMLAAAEALTKSKARSKPAKPAAGASLVPGADGGIVSVELPET